MKQHTSEKILRNTVIDIIKKKDYDSYEKANIIKDYVELQKKQGKTINSVAEELGVSKKEIYKNIQFLEIPKDIFKQVRYSNYNIEKLKRISYALKDKSKLCDVVQITRNKTTEESEKIVAEINDPLKKYTHFERFLFNLNNDLGRYATLIKDIPGEYYNEIEVKIDNVISKLDIIKKRMK